MDEPRPPPPVTDAPTPAPRRSDERLAREAAALRANLLKRKQQARARESRDKADPPDTGEP